MSSNFFENPLHYTQVTNEDIKNVFTNKDSQTNLNSAFVEVYNNIFEQIKEGDANSASLSIDEFTSILNKYSLEMSEEDLSALLGSDGSVDSFSAADLGYLLTMDDETNIGLDESEIRHAGMNALYENSITLNFEDSMKILSNVYGFEFRKPTEEDLAQDPHAVYIAYDTEGNESGILYNYNLDGHDVTFLRSIDKEKRTANYTKVISDTEVDPQTGESVQKYKIISTATKEAYDPNKHRNA